MDRVRIAAGYPFRGRIKPVDGAKSVVVQMRDLTPDGVNWSMCTRTNITGRRDVDWLRAGDILFSARGNALHAILIDESIATYRAVAAPHFFVLRVMQADILPAYVVWWLNQLPAQHYLKKNAQSSTLVSNITRSVLEKTPLVFPSLQQQERIVSLSIMMKREEVILQRLHQTNQTIMAGLATSLLKG